MRGWCFTGRSHEEGLPWKMVELIITAYMESRFCVVWSGLPEGALTRAI